MLTQAPARNKGDGASGSSRRYTPAPPGTTGLHQTTADTGKTHNASNTEFHFR